MAANGNLTTSGVHYHYCHAQDFAVILHWIQPYDVIQLKC